MNNLITPYTGQLTALLGTSEQQAALKLAARDLVSIDLNPRQTADLELLLNGGYTPLTGYMNRADCESVVSSMRRANGTFWPLPITLDVTEKISANLSSGVRVALRDAEGFMLAVLTVGEVWSVDDKIRLGGAVRVLACRNITISPSCAKRQRKCAASSRVGAGAEFWLIIPNIPCFARSTIS